MHICLLTSARISETRYGGEKRYAISLGRWLALHDHNVTLIGSKFPTIQCTYIDRQYVEKEGDDIALDNKHIQREISEKSHSPPYIVYLLSRLWIALLWIIMIGVIHNKNSPIGVIHAQDSGYAGLAALFAGFMLRIPVIVTSHGIRHKTLGPVIEGSFKKIFLNFNRRLDLFTIKHADRVLFTNSAVKEYYERLLRPKAIDVIPMPIRLEQFQFSVIDREIVRREMGIGKDAIVVGFVGRFSPEKNLLTLVSAFANLTKDNSSVMLALVGSGPLEHNLREYVMKNRLQERIIFYGVRNDIGRVLSSFDIFALPSYTEGLSNALLEAMASGRAIICSDIETNREVVTHCEEALLVDPYAAEELENAIRMLSASESLRNKIGRNAMLKSSRYDETIVYPVILQYYKNILKRDL